MIKILHRWNRKNIQLWWSRSIRVACTWTRRVKSKLHQVCRKNLNWSGGWRYLLPVQAVDHLSHIVDEILVFLRVTDNDAMELLHVGINGFKSGCLATACRPTRVCFSGQICSQKSTDMTKYVSQARIDNTSKINHIVVGRLIRHGHAGHCWLYQCQKCFWTDSCISRHMLTYNSPKRPSY